MTSLPKVEGAESARRALRLLEAVTAASEPVGLDELVRSTGWTKATVYRLLRLLQEELYIERAEGGGYRGGVKLLSLAAAVMPSANSVAAYLPTLQELADASGETATLHRRVGRRAVLVTGAYSAIAYPLRRMWSPGEMTPLIRGNAGLAILCGLAPEELDSVLGGEAEDTTRAVRRAVATGRREGYTTSRGANHPGLAGIAAPLGDSGMSISVTGPDERWTSGRMREFAPQLLHAVETAAAAQGYKRHG
jgi:DNA-binding IclR family transcriptional regulator